MSDFFLKKDDEFHNNPLYGNRFCNADSRKADKSIMFCSNCKRCWEFDKPTMRNLKRRNKGKFVTKHYLNFPSYGKKRQLCEDCTSNNE
tara:strand:+ start:4335 stop:4601 length:267 start_codon:yes stop_codon:yes gene_type:complete